MGRRPSLRTLITVIALMTGWSAFTTTGDALAGSGALLEDVPFGTYEITSPLNTSQCLTAGPILADVNRLYVYLDPCRPGDPKQAWEFSPSAHGDAPTGARRVRNQQFGRCLDADNRGGRLTGTLHLHECNDSPNQAWEFKGGLRAPGTACVWVAYLCDVRAVAVPPIPSYDDIPVRLVKPTLQQVTNGTDLFIVR